MKNCSWCSADGHFFYRYCVQNIRIETLHFNFTLFWDHRMGQRVKIENWKIENLKMGQRVEGIWIKSCLKMSITQYHSFRHPLYFHAFGLVGRGSNLVLLLTRKIFVFAACGSELFLIAHESRESSVWSLENLVLCLQEYILILHFSEITEWGREWRGYE